MSKQEISALLAAAMAMTGSTFEDLMKDPLSPEMATYGEESNETEGGKTDEKM